MSQRRGSWWEKAQALFGIAPKASEQQEVAKQAGKMKVILKGVATSFSSSEYPIHLAQLFTIP